MSVLSNLFQEIADAIRGQTGDTAKMSPAAFPAAIAAIEGGGSSTADVLPETALVNTDLGNGLYSLTFPEQFELTAGETYIVEFAGVEYTCEAATATLGTMTGVGIGNPALVGLEDDTGEPFLLGVPNDGSAPQGYTTVADSPITVRIYQEASGESGGEEASSVVYAKGTISKNNIPTSEALTITHNLGVIPDVFIVASTYPSTDATYYLCFGYSSAMRAIIGDDYANSHYWRMGTGSNSYGGSNGIEGTNSSAESYGLLRNATATTITIGGGTGDVVSGVDPAATLVWIAIGGII